MKKTHLMGLMLCMTPWLLFSCTLTKRRYHRGFHVDWQCGINTGHKKKFLNRSPFLNGMKPVEPVSFKPADTTRVAPVHDSLLLIKGEKICIATHTITDKSVQVIPCNDPDSSIRVFDRNSVHVLLHKNGSYEVISEPETDEDRKRQRQQIWPGLLVILSFASILGYASSNILILLFLSMILVVLSSIALINSIIRDNIPAVKLSVIAFIFSFGTFMYSLVSLPI